MTEPPEGETDRSERRASFREGENREALAARLSAVERALGGRDSVPAEDGPERSRLADRVAVIEESLDALDERVGEIEAASQALRGYVGGVRAVNRDVERRADAALATVDRIASELDGGDPSRSGDFDDIDFDDVGSPDAGSAGAPEESRRERPATDGTRAVTEGKRTAIEGERASTDQEHSAPDGIAARLRDAL